MLPNPSAPRASELDPRWGDQFRLMRPRQWPILTVQLAVGVLCAPALRRAWVAETGPAWPILALSWFAWVVALNGGTLAFNSAYDRDTDDVAYLASPPLPPRSTARNAMILMLLGAGAGLAVGPLFAALILSCVALSILYSHPRTRLKGVPGLDLLINAVGYGAGTTLAGLAAGANACGAPSLPDRGGWWLIAGFGLLFGSFYPMTQIYQLEADRLRGDRTLASALGIGGSLALAFVLGAAATGCLGRAFVSRGDPPATALIAGVLWCVFCLVWWLRSGGMNASEHERGMYVGLGLWALVDAMVLLGALGRPEGF